MPWGSIFLRRYQSLCLHKAEIPVGDAVFIQPVDGLAHGGVMKVVNEQAMRDHTNPHTLVG